MAHRLQGLICLYACAGFPAAAQSRPFSHKLHLRLKLECTACHAGAPSSTKAGDNNLPEQTACRRCHERELPIKQPAQGLVTRFNHALHLRMGNPAPVLASAVDRKTYHLSTAGAGPPPALRARLNTGNACAACHRGLEESDAVTAQAFPVMQDCLVCHPGIDPPFSCEKCHEPGPHLKPGDHTAFYVDSHSSGRAKLNKPACVICHGRRFTCLGCH